MEPGITNLVKKTTLRWIFVGGKGGVGKTTTSCSIAIQLAKVRESVLLVSTDPAHNISDAFDQKFSSKPILVNGFDNLFAMEIDTEFSNFTLPDGFSDDDVGTDSLREIISVLPGIDEIVGYIESMKLVSDLTYSVVVFDTAPTGHTIRFLSLPSILDKNVGKILKLKNIITPFLARADSVFGISGSSITAFLDKLSIYSKMIVSLNSQLKNSSLCTFVCVCIAEFLSLYETERLVTFLLDCDMDVENIVVNQLIGENVHCERCMKRMQLQTEYIDKINILYSDFHITKVMQQDTEVRGIRLLKEFSEKLL